MVLSRVIGVGSLTTHGYNILTKWVQHPSNEDSSRVLSGMTSAPLNMPWKQGSEKSQRGTKGNHSIVSSFGLHHALSRSISERHPKGTLKTGVNGNHPSKRKPPLRTETASHKGNQPLIADDKKKNGKIQKHLGPSNTMGYKGTNPNYPTTSKPGGGARGWFGP